MEGGSTAHVTEEIHTKIRVYNWKIRDYYEDTGVEEG